MSGTHGRAGLAGRAWLGTALVASGWIVASGPARACEITHHAKPAAKTETSSTAPSTTASATPTASSPKDDLDKAYQNFLRDWNQAMPPAPPAITPTLTTTATPPAAQTLAPTTPTVANQGTTQPCGCPPPPPCTVPPPAPGTPTGTTPPVPQNLLPPAGATNPTPAPEPSSVASALAMIGAVAWRRRATRPRA